MTPRIGIIVGSTRPGRKGETIGGWVHDVATTRDDAEYVLVDVAEANLPLFDEPSPPRRGDYTRPHTLAWAEQVASLDGFVFVVGEYNHAPPAAVKNAIDFLYAEWNDKAAGFVSYGVDGGVRTVEALRPVLAAVQVATVANAPALRLFGDLGEDGRPADPRLEASLHTTLDQVVSWSTALAPLRAAAPA